MQKLTSVEQEIYTHEYLWRSASALFQEAKNQERSSHNSSYFLISSLLMSFMAYEAFINFCGFVIFPDLWKDEKKYFRGKGIDGKIKKILENLPSFVWDKKKRPYLSIKNLEKFRNSIAHGKVIATKYLTEREEDGSHFKFEYDWDKYLSLDTIESCRADIKLFCQSLVVELRKVSRHLHLIFDAFEGPLGHATGEPVSTNKDIQ